MALAAGELVGLVAHAVAQADGDEFRRGQAFVVRSSPQTVEVAEHAEAQLGWAETSLRSEAADKRGTKAPTADPTVEMDPRFEEMQREVSGDTFPSPHERNGFTRRQPTAVRRADGKWDVTVPVEAKKFYIANGADTETPLAERIEIGLFTAEPGRDAFDKSNVIVMERQPNRSGRQVLKFVTDEKPTHADVDPYNFYIDPNSVDNVLPLG